MGVSVVGSVVEVDDGGLTVDIGVRGYLPTRSAEDSLLGTQVTATVVAIGLEQDRALLSTRPAPADTWLEYVSTLHVGQIVPGWTFARTPEGMSVTLPSGITGTIPASEPTVVSREVSTGQRVFATILDIDPGSQQITLSLRQARRSLAEHFDPARYGMPGFLDAAGPLVTPGGYDPETANGLKASTPCAWPGSGSGSRLGPCTTGTVPRSPPRF